MNIKKLIYTPLFFAALFVMLPSAIKAADTLPSDQEVLELIYKANTYWQEKNPTHGRPFWDRAAYHTGNMAVYDVTKDLLFLEYSIAFAEQNNWMGATSNNKNNWKYGYGESMDYVLFGDWQTCFQVYADLYNIEPDNYKIARAREVMEYQMSTPNSDYWWWVDALYMVMPVMTRMYKITENPLYLEKLHEYWQYTNSIMYDEDEGLYYRDANYIYPKHKTSNGKKDFWSRGNGWAFAAFAKVLTDLPETDPYRATYIAYYTKMAAKLMESQQVEGYWTRSIIDPDYVPGYETSGSAFFTYGLLWGINNGYLSKQEYGEAAEKAWNYLATIALQQDGKVGYVQPIGGSAVPGQYIDMNSTADFGVGAFLLAASEMYKYVGGDTSTASFRLVSVKVPDVARVQFAFNGIVDAASAQNINNYTVNGQPIDGTVDFDGERTVTITLAKTLDYGKYTFAVQDITNESGVAIAGSAVRSIVLPVPLTPDESGSTVTAIVDTYGNRPSNTTDNNFNTRWSCDEKQGWIKYDLGKIKDVYALDIAFYKGAERLHYFDIELSSDNVNYVKVITNGISSGMTNELERFSFNPQSARYVRIICNGNSVDNSSSLTEVRIRYSDTDILNNISLPSKVYADIIMPSGIIWSSSDISVLSPAGLVGFVTTDTPVTLTAQHGSQTKNFDITVSARNVRDNNIVLHYTFDTGDKFTADGNTYLKDKSRNEKHARVYGSAIINGVLDLSSNTNSGFSTNGYLIAPEGILDSLRSYSVLVKVNPERLNNLPRVFDFGSSSANSVFGRLNDLSAGLKYNGETTVYITSSQTLQVAEDTDLAFTFDAASKTTKLYIDGELTIEGVILKEPYELSLIASDTRNYIGRTQWWDTSVASSNVDYCGTMDDFYLFNTALTRNEIMQIQQNLATVLEVNQEKTIFDLRTNPVERGNTICIMQREVADNTAIIDIINPQGMLVSSTYVDSFPAYINPINQSGIYFVRVITEHGQVKTLKLIVK